MTFDFGLATAIRLALQNGRAAPLQTGLMDTLAAWPANQNATFLTNHDQTRIMTELGGDIAAAKLAAFLLLTAPGTPFIYYGEEIGMTGTKPDERIRTPMRWTADEPAAGLLRRSTPWQPLSRGRARGQRRDRSPTIPTACSPPTATWSASGTPRPPSGAVPPRSWTAARSR